MQKVTDIYHVVGHSCQVFEEELMALSTVIEASRSRMDSASTFEWANRDNRVKKDWIALVIMTLKAEVLVVEEVR